MPWQYKVLKVKTGGMVVPNLDGLTESDLNTLGQQEWELVNSIPMAKGGGQVEQVYFYFKRWAELPVNIPIEPVARINCPKCKAPNRPGATGCIQCGANLAQ